VRDEQAARRAVPRAAVELVQATGKTVAEVARDLQINDTT
jgi:transposase-like protein